MKLSKLFVFVSSMMIVACQTQTTQSTEQHINDKVASPETKQENNSQNNVVASSTTTTDSSPTVELTSQQPVLPKIPEAQLEKPEAERFANFVGQLKQKAKAEGISQPVIDQAFANVKLLKRVIASDKNQLEKKITLDDYLQRVLTTARMTRAKEMYKLNAEQLAKAATTYKVPANYIVALWGMESNFGRLQGKENIISAMSSLAFEGRREAFFTNQLMAALRILEDGHVGIDNLKGSWAGAMGQCQFMPTSFIKYGADGDGDGKIDIWNNTADVFASAANYLATEGWDESLPWGYEIALPAEFDKSLAGLEDNKVKSLMEWQTLGVKLNSAQNNANLQMGWIILPDDLEGRAFMVSSNFKTLMHWNRSYYFGISVGMLADSIVAAN